MQSTACMKITLLYITGAPSPPKSSTCTCSDDSESSKLEDLEQQLDLELQHITNRYASYVHCIRKSIKEKGITAQDLCAYLMNLRAFKPKNRKKMPGLMSAMRDELERAKTTDKIFIILSDKCASFLNFEIFQSMIDDYEIDKNQERLNYPQHLREYAEKHKLSEFIDMNPLLKKLDDNAKKIKLKLDIELTCSLAKLNDLRKHLANILGIRKSALRIVDIKQGCVEVTFQIPAPVAEAIFTSDKIFTSQEVNDFQELSVISLKIDEHSFEFKEESNPLQEDEACASKPSTYFTTVNRACISFHSQLRFAIYAVCETPGVKGHHVSKSAVYKPHSQALSSTFTFGGSGMPNQIFEWVGPRQRFCIQCHYDNFLGTPTVTYSLLEK